MKRLVLPVFAVGAFSLAAAGIAYATAEDQVGGGTWNHSVANGYVTSDYWHPSSCHSSSVQLGSSSGPGAYRSSGPTAPGVWAHASLPESIYVDYAYWNNEC